MAGAKRSAVFGELSDIPCEDCDDYIPLKRVRALPGVTTCVGCMEDREDRGTGTRKHRMDYNVKTHGDDIESIETFIVRDGKADHG